MTTRRRFTAVVLALTLAVPIAAAGARKLWVGVRAGDMEGQLHYMRILVKEIMARFV